MLHSQEKLTPEQKQMARRRRILQGRAAQGICILAAFAAISLFAACWLLLRQDRTFSDSETRMLAQKPSLTLASLADGSFAEGLERWYADQFPGRDLWITADLTFQRALGVREMNGVYLGADGYLLEAPAQEDAAQLGQTEAAICAFAAQHPDIRLTAAIVPNAWGVLSEKLPAGVPVEDQKALIDAIDQAMPDVRTANLTEALRSCRSEPLYYRTDHHWTSLGAYYAYQQLCTALGLTPFDTAAHTALTADRFYGTHYSKARTWNAVPDTITWYDLPNQLTIYNVTAAGQPTDGETTGLYDTDRLTVYDKYAMFLHGNNGLSRVQGDGTGKILVIKDSYANCFVPYLTANYADIDVVDFRNYNFGLDQLIADNDYDQILVLYSFDSFKSDPYLYRAGVTG